MSPFSELFQPKEKQPVERPEPVEQPTPVPEPPQAAPQVPGKAAVEPPAATPVVPDRTTGEEPPPASIGQEEAPESPPTSAEVEAPGPRRRFRLMTGPAPRAAPTPVARARAPLADRLPSVSKLMTEPKDGETVDELAGRIEKQVAEADEAAEDEFSTSRLLRYGAGVAWPAAACN